MKSWVEPSEGKIPVKLQWVESSGPDKEDKEPFWFPREVVVHAQDHKLLADCSKIVSELSQINKTGSQTTNEHAALVFLINFHGLQDLHKLMDGLYNKSMMIPIFYCTLFRNELMHSWHVPIYRNTLSCQKVAFRPHALPQHNS
jgi:hypothetical protein